MKPLLLLLFIASLFANEQSSSEALLSRTRALMGTYVTITLPQKDNAAISASFGLIQTIEDSLSTYDPNATLSKLNKTHTVPYDAYLSEAITLSKNYYKETNGYFDITIGSISKKLYHFGEEKTYSPSRKALKKAVLNIDGIHLNTHSITTDTHIVVDLGGMGKGYAVDKVADSLKDQNITQGIIALSGDIQCLHSCELYLQSPFSEATFAKVNTLHPYTSISTSGTYRRYAAKKSEHHLINPKTATQGRAFVSVSLFTLGNNAKIDAYATAVSVMPKEKALAFLKQHKEIGYVLVEPDRNVIDGNLEGLISLKYNNPA